MKGVRWDRLRGELVLSKGWAIFAGFCSLVVVILYLDSLIGGIFR